MQCGAPGTSAYRIWTLFSKPRVVPRLSPPHHTPPGVGFGAGGSGPCAHRHPTAQSLVTWQLQLPGWEARALLAVSRRPVPWHEGEQMSVCHRPLSCPPRELRALHPACWVGGCGVSPRPAGFLKLSGRGGRVISELPPPQRGRPPGLPAAGRRELASRGLEAATHPPGSGGAAAALVWPRCAWGWPTIPGSNPRPPGSPGAWESRVIEGSLALQGGGRSRRLPADAQISNSFHDDHRLLIQ